MNIKYRNLVTIQRPRMGMYIDTDRGDRYEMSNYVNRNVITDWWERQHHSELRAWQKDLCIQVPALTWGSPTPYVLYKINHGFNQPHDIALCYFQSQDIWILSTEQHTWIQRDAGGQVIFDTKTALGTVTDRTVRDQLFEIYDACRQAM